MSSGSDYQSVRTCLKKNFTHEALQRLCYDSPIFRPVYSGLTPGMSEIELINRLLDYAQKKSALAELQRLVMPCNLADTSDQPSQPAVHQPETEPGYRPPVPPTITISIGSDNQAPIVVGNYNNVVNTSPPPDRPKSKATSQAAADSSKKAARQQTRAAKKIPPQAG